ncbi:MAG: hypothetical protein IJ429_01670 [Lachnospiraceae bacterium]|nr:hypothetical protein [Lachnospiraceae bacterium]
MKKYKIFNNFGLKILAVFISILLWLAVINVSDPVINTNYTDIPVVITNTEEITTKGKVYELTSEPTVSISVSAKRSIQDYLSEDNFKAVVDLENYDEETGMVPIRIESNKYNGQIESMKSKTEFASVAVEDMMRKQFVITPVVSGDPEEGYVVGNITTAENIVRVSGAESVVSSIKKVTAEMSVSGLSSDVKTSVDLKLYDEEGRQVKDANLNMNIGTVAMSAQILATKELPLRFSVSGSPKEGYGISGDVTSDKDTVVVAGKASSLAYMSSVDVASSAVKVDGADSDVQIEVDLTRYLPEGIVLADEDKDKTVNVQVPIDEILEKEFEIPVDDVEMNGLPESLSASVIDSDDIITVYVEGFAKQVTAMQISDVKLSVDWGAYQQENNIEQLRKGRYRVPAAVSVPDGIEKAADEITILVELKQK